MKVHRWTFEEERALTEFLGLAKTSPDYGLSGKEWPSLRHNHQLWTDAALHIRESTSSNMLLTSKHQVKFDTLHFFVCNLKNKCNFYCAVWHEI